MSQAHDDLVARAQDPRTPLTTLHSLAQNYPGLRPIIARNPSTYPALLEWLGSLGDPAVDAALSSRRAATTGESTVSLPPVVIPSRQRHHAQTDAVQPTTEPIQPLTSSTLAAGSDSTAAAGAGTASRPALVNAATRTAITPKPQPTSQKPPETDYDSLDLLRGSATEDTDPGSTGDNMLPWIALAAAVVVLVAVMLIVFTGTDRSASTTQPTPSAPAAPRATASSPAHRAPSAPATARTPAPSPSEPPTTATPTVPATPTPQLVAPAPQDAADLGAFTDPTGNITCQLSGQQASCSIKERSFATEECPADGSYKAAVEPGTSPYGACAEDYQAAPTTLETGRSATQGDFACTVGASEVRCWSQSTGKGFSLAADGATSIDLTQR